MVYKLHGVGMSTCTQRVLIAATEAGLEVQVVPVDFAKGEHKSPEFMKLQPFGQVPVLEDTEAGITIHE
jgi:glutathione S-transferase